MGSPAEPAYLQGVQRHHATVRASIFALAIALSAVVAAGCGSSSKSTTSPPATPTASSPTPTASPSPTNSASVTPSATENPATRALASGRKSATCVNGWIQPAPGADFFKQATRALEQSQGAAGYVVKAVRYFAGPLTGGGIGAVYYLDVADPRLSARVVLVSGAGPSQAAVAKSATTGWKQGDWTGFAGSQPAAAHPPLPGKWAGPEFDPVGGATPLLSSGVAGCLAGT